MTRLDPLATAPGATADAIWRTAVPAWDATWRAVDDDDRWTAYAAIWNAATWGATWTTTHAAIADATADATRAIAEESANTKENTR